jgi:hypothetical protein
MAKLRPRRLTVANDQLCEKTSAVPNAGEDENAVVLQKFPTNSANFSSLPTELRLKIWKLACPRGRIIELMSCTPSNIVVPAIAHINRESRSEALQIYNVGFRHTRSTVGKMWWSPSADIIYLANGSEPLPFYDIVLGPDISQIRHLALDYELESFLDWSSCINIKMLRNMDALETLYMVLTLHISALDLAALTQPSEVPRDPGTDPTVRQFEGLIMQQLKESKEALERRRKIATIEIVFKWGEGFWRNGVLIPY